MSQVFQNIHKNEKHDLSHKHHISEDFHMLSSHNNNDRDLAHENCIQVLHLYEIIFILSENEIDQTISCKLIIFKQYLKLYNFTEKIKKLSDE